MDPVTILQTVGAATELTVIVVRACQEIYKFSNEVKTIDRTLSRIEEEVTSLDSALRMVKHGLEDHAVERVSRTTTGRDILTVVSTSVGKSQSSLARLKQILDAIIGDPNESGSSMRALRQAVRAKRQNKELYECLAQVDKSKQSLSLCLTTLSVYIVANLPRYRRSSTTVEDIAPLTRQLESKLQAPKHSEDSRIRRTAASVLESAKSPPPSGDNMSTATTLLADTDLDNDDIPDDNASLDSEGPVRKWMSLLESTNQSKTTSRRGSTSRAVREQSSFESEPDLEDSALTEPANERFQIGLVRQAIEEGDLNYQKGNFEQATALFEEAVSTAVDLSKAGRTFLERDLIRVRLYMAAIYIKQEKALDTAEQHLLQAVVDIEADKRSNTEEMQQQIHQAFQQLGKVYMLQGKYSEAQSYGEEAMNGNLILYGKDSTQYYETLQMLILIYNSRNNNVRAQLLFKQLPEDRKDRVKKQMQAGPLTPPTNHNFPPLSSSTSTGPFRKRQSSSYSSTIMPHGLNLQSTPAARDTNSGDSGKSLQRIHSDSTDSNHDQSSETRELSLAGFKGDFDAHEALAWAIVEDRQHIVHALISQPGVPVLKKRTFGQMKQVYKFVDVKSTPRKDGSEFQPLLLATTTPGRVMIAKMLLERGARKDICNSNGHSLLEVAAMHGQQEIISVLIEHGASLRGSEGIRAFHLAAQHNRVNVLGFFLDKGMKPDIIDANYGYGRTAVNAAAQRGHERAVDFLISRGADPNLPDRGGSTPLMGAVRERHEGVTKLLLRLFADVNMANDRGQTALIVATEQGNLSAVNMILDDLDVRVDARDSNGWTALIWACNRRQVEVARAILEHGQAKVNATCFRGSKALDHAKGCRPLIDLLKSYGAEQGTGVAHRGPVDNAYQGYVLL